MTAVNCAESTPTSSTAPLPLASNTYDICSPSDIAVTKHITLLVNPVFISIYIEKSTILVIPGGYNLTVTQVPTTVVTTVMVTSTSTSTVLL